MTRVLVIALCAVVINASEAIAGSPPEFSTQEQYALSAAWLECEGENACQVEVHITIDSQEGNVPVLSYSRVTEAGSESRFVQLDQSAVRSRPTCRQPQSQR
jgi:hypothetical protein